MSAYDGKSVLVLSKGLDDLVTYLYNMYNSMNIDFAMQFEILPISIRTLQHSFQERDPLQKQFYKMDETSCIEICQKNHRKSFMRKYMSRKRGNAQFKTAERSKDAVAKKIKRQNVEAQEKERKRNTAGRKLKRQFSDVLEKEREMNTTARKMKRQNADVLEKERKKIQVGES